MWCSDFVSMGDEKAEKESDFDINLEESIMIWESGEWCVVENENGVWRI